MYRAKRIINWVMTAGAVVAINAACAGTVSACPCNVDVCSGYMSCTADGQVSIFDADYIYECALHQADLWCGRPLSYCDVNCDGEVDECDASAVILAFLGEPYPCAGLVCGACCYTDGNCGYRPQNFCDQDPEATYLGDWVSCTPDPCPGFCGDGVCDGPVEDPCNCPPDCGEWVPTEEPGSTCDDGIDNDCDGLIDCDDEPDCLTDPACGPYCPNTVCESPDEDSCNCPEDCGEPPATETPGATCNDGIDNDCDGWTDCDDEPDCLTDPACGPYCPNTVCEEPDEDYCSCPEDCEVPPDSEDCNGNGLPDECDISDGTSQDCNENGIPDECEWTVLAQSTFEADEEDDGWHEYQPDEVEISWVASGGNPDGYLRTRDPSMYSGARIAAPPEFLGDWSAIDGVGYFQFDARFIMDPGNYPLSGTFPYILLIGSGGVASYHSDVLWSTDWQTFSAPVNEALWVVSEGTWADLLANVEVVLLGAEATLGRDENGFDNIFLLVSDCNDNGVLDECDIESGTSEDCNTNGVPDECDITGGMRQDCNENTIPDECDIADGTSQDCNANGVPDECDIADGTSDDANENGVPDECDIGACCDDSSRLCADGVADDDCPGRWIGGAACSTAPFDPPCGLTPRIALVPVAPPPETGITYLPGTVISGNEITIPVGQRVWLDVTLSNWDWDLDGDPRLVAWQAQIDSSGYTSGLHGQLSPATVFCTEDTDCEVALGHGAVCDEPSFFRPDLCGPGFIDTSRTDSVMASCPLPWIGGSDLSTPDFRFGGTCCTLGQVCDSIADPGVPLYAATLVLDIPEDAGGTFTLGLEPPPMGSVMVDQESTLIPLVSVAGVQITTRLASCCLPEGDCIDTTPSDCEAYEGTIVAACLGDGNGDGQDDGCQCPQSSQPEPERLDLPTDPISQKVRYLSFSAGDAGQTQAIRVTFVDLPAPYDHWNGTQLWVQPPEVFCENAGVREGGSCPAQVGGLPQNWFWGAELGCDPYWTDWTQYDLVHVWHEGIIPDGTYDLQAIDSMCPTYEESAYSLPLTLTQSIWADLVRDCEPPGPCSPPNGSTDIADITAVLDKWKNLTGNVSKVRADIEGSPSGDHRVPDQAINITDVTYCLGAFLGDTYPGPGFPPPSDPPVCP